MQGWQFWVIQVIWVLIAYVAAVYEPSLLLWLAAIGNGVLAMGFLLNWGQRDAPSAHQSATVGMGLRIGGVLVIWLTYLGMIVYGLQTAGAWGIGLAAILMLPVVILSVIIWRIMDTATTYMRADRTPTAKHKRDQHDTDEAAYHNLRADHDSDADASATAPPPDWTANDDAPAHDRHSHG
jgi:lysylphosphatidylglycerol synthetase-like protein (DUF2156 family)